MTFREVSERLGLGEPHPAMAAAWPESEARFAAGELGFARPEALAETARFLGLAEEFIAALTAALPAIRADEALLRYLLHCRRLLAEGEPVWPAMGAGFPVIKPETSDAASMGYAVVLLEAIPAALALFKKRNIPDAVARETLADAARWIGEYRRTRGRWGLSNLGWMQNHLRCRIFALGRLQFRLEHYGFDFHGWRDRETGRVLLLAGEGMTFRPPGLQLYGEGAERAPDAWTAFYGETEGEVRGMPVDPRGWPEPRPVRLPRPRWEPVLGKGSPTVGIHIPAGAPMDFEACGEAFARAPEFLARHVPEHPAEVFTCGSWLLDPQFEGRLPESSNIVRFLREMYLHPLAGGTDYALFERVFDRRRPGPEEPLEGLTTLQRAVLEFGRKGGTWRTGASVLFRRDLRWGGRPYRAMWPDGVEGFENADGKARTK